MNETYFQPVLNAAEFLGDTRMYEELQQMQSVYQQKLYFVAFIGQFSAGKSSLLNNLLKRDILPEGTTETTSLLTYIRYGEREDAKLHYTDGSIRRLNLKEVAEIAQQADIDEWKLDESEFLEIFLPDDLLRSGMILLDTPGINTLIERHERLLETSLSLAAGIIYVTGGAPSSVDKEKLSMLTDAGFDISFVRTHCDAILEREQTLEQAKADDQKTLKDCGIDAGRCYYVSNKDISGYSADMDKLRDMLIEKGKHAGEELEKDIEDRLKVQAKNCRKALEKRRDLLNQIQSKNTESLNKQQNEILDKIKKLDSRLEESEKALQKQTEACRRELQDKVRPQLEETIRNSGKRIEKKTTVTNENDMTKLLRKEAKDFSHQTCQLINVSLDSVVQHVNSGDLFGEMELETLALPKAENYQELRTEQDNMAEYLRGRLSMIQQSREELARSLEEMAGSPEYLQLQNALDELQTALMKAQKERNDLPPYAPQMVLEEPDGPQPSQIAHSIGAALDWIMLLIPGEQIEAAIINFAKLPKVANISGKLVGILEKTGKILKQGDPLKDVLFALKNLNEHTRTSKRREHIAEEVAIGVAKGAGQTKNVFDRAMKNDGSDSILDMLTFEHLAEKLGQKFDRPPRLVEDKEYEKQYRERKEKLETEYLEMKQRVYQKNKEMHVFKTEQEERRAKEESLMIDQDHIERELKKRENELRKAAKEEALKQWRHDCAVWYQREEEQYLQDVLNSYMTEFPIRLEEYQRQRVQEVQDALQKEQAAYQELVNAPEDEVVSEFRKVQELLENINNVYPEQKERTESSSGLGDPV